MSLCDGSTCVHMPPMHTSVHAYVGNTGACTAGMGCYSGGGAHGLLPFLEPQDVSRASLINERMMRALTKSTGVPFKGVLQGNFKCDKAGVTCSSFGYRSASSPSSSPSSANYIPIHTNSQKIE